MSIVVLQLVTTRAITAARAAYVSFAPARLRDTRQQKFRLQQPR